MNGYQLPRNAPETQGIPSAAILKFVEEVEKNIQHLHSLMFLRHGQVVAEGWWTPYAPNVPHMLFSLTKSFTSTAMGLSLSEGRLSIDDPVISFFPDLLPAEVSENLKGMRIRQLLCMSTGHKDDATGPAFEACPTNWVKGFLSLPVEFKPGTHFVYNSAASHMLSAIVQKVTGQTLLDYLMPRLFESLGIDRPTWQNDPTGINTGGWGLNLKTEDIARFGQMLLQKGLWNGQRILPEAWINEATSRQVSNGCYPESDWDQGYGYQFWRCKHNGFRGDGAFGQYCIVMPDQDAVLAITSGVGDMQAVMNLAWDVLQVACGPEPLAPNPLGTKKLAMKLSNLALKAPAGAGSSSIAAQVSGKRFNFEANKLKTEAISFEFTGSGCAVWLRDAAGEHRLTCGSGDWALGETTMFSYNPLDPTPPEPTRVAACGVWTAEDMYQMTVRFYETPFCHTVKCQFTGEQVKITSSINVSFGPNEAPELIGKQEKA